MNSLLIVADNVNVLYTAPYSSPAMKRSESFRRLSTVIAPQFTKIEPINILQKVDGVEIRISDMAQVDETVNLLFLFRAGTQPSTQ